MKVLEKANLIWGAFVTLMVAIFGVYWFQFLGFLVLNFVDYITGFIKAKFYNKNESSAIGAKGIWKKVSYWIIIGISFFMALCFVKLGDILSINLSFMVMLGWFTLATYLINETRSIVENCVEMNIKVPAYLIKGLDIAEKLIDQKTNIDE